MLDGAEGEMRWMMEAICRTHTLPSRRRRLAIPSLLRCRTNGRTEYGCGVTASFVTAPSLRAVDVAAAAARELPLRTIYAPHEKMFIGARLSERERNVLETQFMVCMWPMPEMTI